MCLILVAWRAHPDHRLIVAANRDEYFDRPAKPAAFWDDRPDVLAGIDMTAGGTWMGVTRGGRFAAITNYRSHTERNPAAPSRGRLVADFLGCMQTPADYFADIATRSQDYNGFSMIASDTRSLCFFSNRGHGVMTIEPGVHGLSNHLLNTPWPKVESGKRRLAELIERQFDASAYLDLLDDSLPATDESLPDTGVGPTQERHLSSIRIPAGEYGTRCSTVLRIDRSSAIGFWERSYARNGGVSGDVEFEFVAPLSGKAEAPLLRAESRPR